MSPTDGASRLLGSLQSVTGKILRQESLGFARKLQFAISNYKIRRIRGKRKADAIRDGNFN